MFLVFGLLFLLIGVFILWAASRIRRNDKYVAFVLGSYFLIFGILILVFFLADNEELLYLVLALGVGGLFLGCGIWNLAKPRFCRGAVVGSTPVLTFIPVGGMSFCIPRFSAMYGEGRTIIKAAGRLSP